MTLKTIAPKAALNKMFLKEPLQQADMTRFKQDLNQLFERLHVAKEANEKEDFHKIIIRDFLKTNLYADFEINLKGKKDLVIYGGTSAQSPINVLFEVKQPNSGEMIAATKPNNHALYQLIFYYLDERIQHKTLAIKQLIATDIYNWYIFDENVFDKHFYNNESFVKAYKDYKSNKKKTKDFFNYAAQLLDELPVALECTYFNFNDFKTVGETDLIALYKILSPTHLLKLPLANDSNQLDKNFYAELLHIIGLEEYKEGSKKLIRRKTQPDDYSLLENTITKLKQSKIKKHQEILKWGNTWDEQIYNIALELSLTWVNRILFLKLLETQLIAYHRGNSSYAFLHSELIYDYPRLNTLFFEVLAERPSNRTQRINTEFEYIPYLNSSLFDLTFLEEEALQISNLEHRKEMPIFHHTVLKNDDKSPKTGTLSTLNYLFTFLDAYNFASEGNKTIQADNRNLINASVLGLIFEKINGYKDGSFFTPGFITMYMCRETIRRAVLQKFKAAGFEADTFETLAEEIAIRKQVKQANALLNTLKICDPAVGSGHFLVSALNEMMAIKFELGVLLHRDGTRVSDVLVQVKNDELRITDEDSGQLFQYFINEAGFAPHKRQRLQEMLFHEKQTIIENCLFGVDINPNSVKICRLRLWIELLKHAYYRQSDDKALNFKELETLPNIDINIKEGNSLISKLNINDDYNHFNAARRQQIRNLVPLYKAQVDAYKSVKDKTDKTVIQNKIADCLTALHGLYNPDDKDYIAWKTKEAEWQQASHSFLKDQDTIEKLKTELEPLATKYKNKMQIYQNAFEWRFAFPEVLDTDGAFVGFDVIIGNPPYISSRDWKQLGIAEKFKGYYNHIYKTATYQMDLYVLFIERSFSISKSTSIISLIVPNSWLSNTYSESIRHFILTNSTSLTITATPTNTFEGISVDTVFFNASKNGIAVPSFQICKLAFGTSTSETIGVLPFENYSDGKTPISMAINASLTAILSKIKSNCKELGELADITRGVHPYRTGGYGVSAFETGCQTQKDVDERPYNSIEFVNGYRPFIYGKNLKRFERIKSNEYINYGKWLAEPRESTFFEGERVYSRKILGQRLIVTFVQDDSVADQQVYITKPKQGMNALYLTGVLGSKLMSFYIRNYFDEVNDAFPQIKVKQLKSLPINAHQINTHAAISNLVEQVLSKKQATPSASTADLETAIDALVYALYELSAADIALIEAAVK
jgi:hypothetical protein